MKELIGIKESDTGLSQPSQWDLVSDKQMMQEEQPLQVRSCVCATPQARHRRATPSLPPVLLQRTVL